MSQFNNHPYHHLRHSVLQSHNQRFSTGNTSHPHQLMRNDFNHQPNPLPNFQPLYQPPPPHDNFQPPTSRNASLYFSKPSFPVPYESSNAIRSQLLDFECSLTSNLPTLSSNIALCDVGGYARPPPERKQPHPTANSNRGEADKHSNKTCLDSARTNTGADYA
ncbi:hypothetical protein H5410_005420 [Solanum commersonii]|uniref:Uncharacterized protein n=1 Tax=Solanum commersonii TaxID=4109 RepID=A0A9J6A786_SOLCO|nr:hypothetical protein H5410_005420 [Solanum commersonii]